MNHAVVTEHLADYLEGDLALDLRALVDAHLDTCPACGLEVREMQQTIRILRALPEPETPPMIAANVMRRIRAGEAQPSFFERVARVLGGVLEPSFVLPASAMAVAALVIFVIQQGGGPFMRSLDTTDTTDAPASAGRDVPLATNGAPRAAVSLPYETDRSFGASAARELAAGTVPSPESAESSSFRVRPQIAARSGSVHASRDPLTFEPWGSPAARPELSRRQGGAGGSFFGDPVLAQGFAAEVAGPGTTPASNHVPQALGSAVPTSLARPAPGTAQGLRVENSGGEDPRDAWLARALENPVGFAQYIARHNLAEQELWVERLCERALSRGLLTELVDALRAAGDEKASWLADDFAAQAEADGSSTAGADAARASEGSPALGR